MPRKTWKLTIINFLENNRGLVILLFCLPASLLFDLALSAKRKLHKLLFSSPKLHDSRVKKIQAQVQAWNKLPQPQRKPLCTSRPNWLSLSTTFFSKHQCHQVNIDLFDILELDEGNLTLRVEPMVTVGEVTSYLVPRGYTLAVTLEIADATLGGLAMGTGMTTHSHKVGLYQETVLSYEVVLGDGSLVTASSTTNQDLYKALPWSHGSLGFLVALTLQIVKVKPYIKLSYIPVKGEKNYCDLIRLVAGDHGCDHPTADYVEATIFSRTEAVIMTGDYSDYDPQLPVNHVAAWYKPWFYKYTESFLAKGKHIELVPLREYLLRHNRAIFWVVESMIPFGNHPLFRLLFGWLLPPKPAFLKFTTTPGIRSFTFTKQVFQDIVLPIRELEEQIRIAEELFDAYPLLVYPCRVYDRGQGSGQIKPPKREHLVEGADYAMFNDLGIYGVPGFVKYKQKYDPYKATEKNTGLDVALKKVCVRLTEDGIPMNTLREISLLRQLNTHNHPNIVRLLDVCHGQQMDKELVMYLVFEHVEQDLATYIEKNSRGFSGAQIRNMSREILDGVDFLHSSRVVHRDLKPQNLLVTKEGHIKLADFGLAKTYDFEMKLTSVVVTLWYRAPEVLLGLPYATPVDIWSIGCIIVELYTLKPLFCGSSEGDQLSKIFRLLGKPPEAEWPEENVSIKWDSLNVINQVRLDQIAPNICETAQDLVMTMLTFNPNKRITAMDALSHRFFTEEPLNT